MNLQDNLEDLRDQDTGSAGAGSTGELAAHLPWLLHLLLLTEAGAAPASAEETSGRSAEVVHEASENLSATTVHLVASSQPSRLASDHQSRKQEDHSTSVASSHVSDEVSAE